MRYEELTERFYLVRGQRNKLLWACQKALAAFDEANKTGKSSWKGEDVDEMRRAVASCNVTEGSITCASCGERGGGGQFLGDGRWVCTEVCRRELAEKQSYDDLAASGGIVDAP